MDEQVTPQDVLDDITEGARIFSELSARLMEEFVFFDRTLLEWADYLMITIPPELNEAGFRSVMIELSNKWQIVNNYYSISSALAKAFAGGSDMKKSDVVAAIVARYMKEQKKRPASTTIERMADSYMHNTISTSITSAVVKDFWKQRLDQLLETRKILEQLGMSLHVEAKYI